MCIRDRLYVRCPQPYPGEAVSRMKFNLYSTRGSQANFTHLGNGTARILPKGGTNWTDSVASEGILSLPAGFEGYILAPFAEMRQDSIAGQTAGRVAVSTTFQFSALGGEAGGFLVDSCLLYTSKPRWQSARRPTRMDLAPRSSRRPSTGTAGKAPRRATFAQNA